jgi:formamidopyrimidine-DNA glycosylase
MDQELIAGIGNIFSDEITFQAGVRPDRKVKDLSDDEMKRIYEEMKRVLRRAIELGAELDEHADEFLIPHRGRNGECPRGHGKLVKKTIGGRSSYFCPACQK